MVLSSFNTFSSCSVSDLNYFHCRRIVEILKETEKDTKNIFGYYSSQRMQDWQEIVKLYEADSAYLAESAQILFRNVQYEIPNVRRQITKYSSDQDDCDKREADCLKNAEGMRQKFKQACKQMQIPGENIKRELVAMLNELPSEYDKIVAACREAQDVAKFYESTVAFLLAGREVPECVPLFRFLSGVFHQRRVLVLTSFNYEREISSSFLSSFFPLFDACIWDISIGYKCEDGRFPESVCCVTISNPDLLSRSGIESESWDKKLKNELV